MAKNSSDSKPLTDKFRQRKHTLMLGGMTNSTVHSPDFTGLARSIECYKNGVHNNYRVLTLYIVNGRVFKMDISDAYASFEALEKLDWWNDQDMQSLIMNWEDKRTLGT